MEMPDDLLSWSEYVKLVVGLLSLADPIGNLPIILTLTKDSSHQEKKHIFRASVVTFVITLFIFTFIGVQILNFFGITIEALKISGGILFLFYALEMLDVIQLPQSINSQNKQPQSIGIVPIGIPILAGPGTITKVVVYSDLHNSLLHKFSILVAIVTVGLLIYSLFRMLVSWGKSPDKIMMTIVTKVMGLLLAGIAVEFILEGIVEYLPG